MDDPTTVESYHVDDLRELALKYPYSQIIQLMYGLRLRTSSEHLFNQQLGKTAVLTNNRAVLFELFENKPRSINEGVETVEVEQVEPIATVMPEVAEVPVAPPLEEKPIAELEQKEEVSPPEEPKVEISAGESPKEIEVPAPPPPKKELPSATPENLQDLSPQERVQAILARNRQLREQFDSQKSNQEEKLFDDKPTMAAEEEVPVVPNPPLSKEESPEPIEEATREEENLEVNSIEPEINESIASEELNEIPEPAPESLPVPEPEPITEPEPVSQESSLESEDREPWTDSPIDIEALIRRRFARKLSEFETKDEPEEDLWAEEESDPWDEEDLVIEDSTEEEEEIPEAPVAPVAEHDEELPDTEPQDNLEPEEPESEEDLKTDLAMASRIRVIRERLDTLKDSDALSKEELDALMEEHRQLEALMSDLPVDEKQLFEVDVKEEDSDRDPDNIEALDYDPVEVQGTVHIPEMESPEEELSPETDSNQKEEDLPAEADEDLMVIPDPDEDIKESEEQESETEPEAVEPTVMKVLKEDKAQEEESIEDSSEPADKKDDVPAPKADTPETKTESQAPVEKNESGEEDLDSEIARIEALAAQLKSGRGQEMSRDEANSLREKRMNEMIEARKKDLEANIKEAEQEAEEVKQDSSEGHTEIVGDSEDGNTENLSSESENIQTQNVDSQTSDSDSPESHEESTELTSQNSESEVQPTQEEEILNPEPEAETLVVEEEQDTLTEVELNSTKEDSAETSADKDESESVLSEESNEQLESEEEEEESLTDESITGPSFSQWLKNLGKTNGGNISDEEDLEGENEETRGDIAEKIELLDSFVEKLPELKKQSREEGAKSNSSSKTKAEGEAEGEAEGGSGGLVTETLAKVYIRQKHYKKAIQAYEILMLKYPEKSSFFASQISEIKKLDNSK